MGNNNVYNNEIIAEINIEKYDINKEIRIINSYEEYDRQQQFSIYFPSHLIDDYKNEKEIKKCIIKINNKKN